jgi:hypothetical protein
VTAPIAPVKVAPSAVRMRPGQRFWWDDNLRWRRGPDTPDGWWMIHPFWGAVRIIEDERAPERTAYEFDEVLTDAVQPDRRSAQQTRHDAQDAYLTALTIAAEIPPAELVRLRDAVRAGRAGGATDGRRPRKGAAS